MAEYTDTFIKLAEQTLKAGSDEATRPPLCLPALNSALAFALNEALLPGRIKHPALIDALVTFTFEQDTDEKIDELAKCLPICKCDKNDPIIMMMHVDMLSGQMNTPDIDIRGFSGLSTLLFRTVLIVVNDHFDLARFERLKDPKKRKAKDAGYLQTAHYFNSKPLRMLMACTAWYKRWRDPKVIEFLAYARKVYHAPFDKHAADIGPHLPQLIVDDACDLLRKAVKAPAKLNYEAEFRTLYKFVGFLHGFLSGASERAQFALFTPHARHIYRQVCAIVKEVDANRYPGLDKIRMEILPQLAYIGDFAHLVATPLSLNPGTDPLLMKYSDRQFKPPLPEGQSYLHTFRILSSLKMRRRCTKIGCNNAPSPKAGKLFSKCSGCKLCSYCSVECQRTAWNDPTSPHKRVCKTWGPLFSSWPHTLREYQQFTHSVQEEALREVDEGIEKGGTGDDDIDEALKKRAVMAVPGTNDAQVAGVLKEARAFATLIGLPRGIPFVEESAFGNVG